MIVVFPYSTRDEDLALRNLQWWNELGGCKGHQCLLMHDKRCAPDLVSSIGQEAFKAFDNVEMVPAGAAIDGWPEGANYFFRLAAATLQSRPQWRYFFWMEPDAIPLQKGWLDTLEAEYKRAGKPFMGDRVEVEKIPLHMSGVGFYPNPLHLYAGEAYRAHETAFDMAGKDQIVPRAHFTKLIEHAWQHKTFTDPHELQTQMRPECILFHSSKDGSLIDLLRHDKANQIQKRTDALHSDIHEKRGFVAATNQNETLQESVQPQTSRWGEGNLSPIPQTTSGIEVSEVSSRGQDSRRGAERQDREAQQVPAVQPTSASGDAARSPSKLQRPPDGGMDMRVVPPEGPRSITCDIFIKTYTKDAEWLDYCRRSIARFGTGFHNVVIIGDQKEYCDDGYLSQQIYKVYADTFTDADWILHMDSDAMFTRPVSPETYLIDGKPRWMITPNSDLEKSLPWFEVIREFMGENAEFEFMRRFPFLFPRWFYPQFRQFILTQHGVDAETYIKNRPNRSFSEFNCMGAFAYKFLRDKFHWIDTSKDPWPELTVDQLWSHGGLTEENKARREKILSGEPAQKLPEPEYDIPKLFTKGVFLSNLGEVKTIPEGIKVLPGDIWVLEGGDQISQWVEQEGRLDHDQNFLPFVLKHINEGDTVIDIGAHIGDHAIAYAHKAGEVHAFEPNPISFECLSHNLSPDIAPRAAGVFLHQVALGDKVGSAPLSGNNGQPGGGYIGEHMKVADVEMRPLDGYKIKADFIKIDVEGYELNVLRGGEATIEENRPIMVIEINFGALRRQGNVPGDIFSWLKAHDYSYTIIQENCGRTSPMYDVLCMPVAAPLLDKNDLLTNEQVQNYIKRIGKFSGFSLQNKAYVMRALVFAGLKEKRKKKKK
jgi:FkbM family methyltransferase